MEAKDLIGRDFKVVGTDRNKNCLIIYLEEPYSLRQHTLRISEEGGPGASHLFYNWTQVEFDGHTIFKS